MNGTRDPESSTESSTEAAASSSKRIVPSTFLPKLKSRITAKWVEENADTLKLLAPELTGDATALLRYARNMWDKTLQFISGRYSDHMQDVAVQLDLKTPNGELIKAPSDMINHVVGETNEYSLEWLERMLMLLRVPHSRKHSVWVNEAQKDLEEKYNIEITKKGKETTTFVQKIAYQCLNLKHGQRLRRVLRERFNVVFLERNLGERHEQKDGMVLVRSETIVLCGITGTVAHYEVITNQAKVQASDLQSLVTQALAQDHSSGAVDNFKTEIDKAIRRVTCSLEQREARSARASDKGLENGQSSAEDASTDKHPKEGGSGSSANDRESLSSLDEESEGEERERKDDDTWWYGKQNPKKPNLKGCVDKESGHYFDSRGAEWLSMEHKANFNKKRNQSLIDGWGIPTAKKMLAHKGARRKQGKRGSAAVAATTSARAPSARSKVWFILCLVKK